MSFRKNLESHVQIEVTYDQVPLFDQIDGRNEDAEPPLVS